MIGKKLRELLKLTNTKQIKLAKFVGISPSRLSNYLADKREPDIEMLAKMARYLHVDLNYFTKDSFYDTGTDYNVALEVSEPNHDAPFYDIMGHIVMVPFLKTNQKEAKTALPISTLFTKDAKPEDLVVFEAHQNISNYALKGDYIIAEKYTQEKGNPGDIILSGINHYKLAIGKDTRFLISEKSNKIVYLDNDTNYYIVKWVLTRAIP